MVSKSRGTRRGGCRGRGGLLFSARILGIARLRQGSGMVQARRGSWLLERAESAGLYGPTRIGARTKLRASVGLVLQSGRAGQSQCGGKYRLSVPAWTRSGNGLRASAKLVLQSGRASKLERGESTGVHESVWPGDSAGFRAGAGVVPHRGGPG